MMITENTGKNIAALSLRSRMERVNGIEPSSPGWKPGVITIIRHPLTGAMLRDGSENVTQFYLFKISS